MGLSFPACSCCCFRDTSKAEEHPNGKAVDFSSPDNKRQGVLFIDL